MSYPSGERTVGVTKTASPTSKTPLTPSESTLPPRANSKVDNGADSEARNGANSGPNRAKPKPDEGAAANAGADSVDAETRTCLSPSLTRMQKPLTLARAKWSPSTRTRLTSPPQCQRRLR
jgi:hypothetical protein